MYDHLKMSMPNSWPIPFKIRRQVATEPSALLHSTWVTWVAEETVLWGCGTRSIHWSTPNQLHQVLVKLPSSLAAARRPPKLQSFCLPKIWLKDAQRCSKKWRKIVEHTWTLNWEASSSLAEHPPRYRVQPSDSNRWLHVDTPIAPLQTLRFMLLCPWSWPGSGCMTFRVYTASVMASQLHHMSQHLIDHLWPPLMQKPQGLHLLAHFTKHLLMVLF